MLALGFAAGIPLVQSTDDRLQLALRTLRRQKSLSEAARVLIPIEAARHNEMMSPTVTE